MKWISFDSLRIEMDPCCLREASYAVNNHLYASEQVRALAHVYNHWSYMPSLAEQHQRMESFTAPFTVLRLLTPLKMSYEVAKKRAEPYNKIVGELPEWRGVRWKWRERGSPIGGKPM